MIGNLLILLLTLLDEVVGVFKSANMDIINDCL